jgi:hypothetical protein
MTAQGDGTVWAATAVPSPSPVDGFGTDGYCVAWVDLDAGARVQVLVDSPAAPDPGTRGVVTVIGEGASAFPRFDPRP